jgi:hypothetical protein
MIAPNDEVIFGIEEDFEPAFVYLLHEVEKITNVDRTRMSVDAITPRVSVKLVAGQGRWQAHYQLLQSGRKAYTAWNGTKLELDIVTNRTTNGAQHAILLGKCRRALQFYNLLTTWPSCGAKYSTLTDVWEEPSIHTFDSESNLDTTTLTFNLLHNIIEQIPSIFPTNL